ncbi:TetR/AcrR family transcriptional regulator [Oleiagrimonas soli]|uniref:AcrR family transcriptional regulator n=1 Tax=Oleiagrimonas soli TaxID=1543381 RepID=A0A099CVX4_9GAMM|nr:TetR/AcrR family transcriptional regulator [Oleiagrimonas soli]KGI78078.1 hypothetical protein LF63_0106845 [Oleiagrimonas soli]MBB6183506.1 AcrR family transcriptional regulator [Oleiagrimonas soli]
MNKPVSQTSDSPVRERLLDAADRLFYREGVRAVGIDRVLAEANAAKASLYSNFGCKDELIAAYAVRKADMARAGIETYVGDAPPEARVLRFFDFLVDWVASEHFRGCPMQHIVGELPDAEHPARRVAAEQRNWLLQRLTEWSDAAGVDDPQRIAGVLLILFDGAVASALQDGMERARQARWAAERLLESAKRQGD